MIRRALCRASGYDPPRRGKRGKNWKIPENSGESPEEGKSSLGAEQSKNQENQSQKEEKLKLANLKYDTLFVDTKTDIKGLFSTHFDDFDQMNEKLGLIGLHTCGNLAANSLQIFLANDCMKFCCNVGCCYHLLQEEFYTNPYEDTGCDSQTE